MQTSCYDIDFKHLLDTYTKDLCIYAMNYVRVKEDAEDIVQDVFMHFWEKKNKHFPNERAVKTYLFNSVRNACLNQLKRNITSYNIDLLKLEIIDEEYRNFDEKTLQNLQQELAQMPEQTGKVITCIFMQNMKYQEAADTLNISINSVKTLLRNGIKHLRLRFRHRLELLFVITWKINKEIRNKHLSHKILLIKHYRKKFQTIPVNGYSIIPNNWTLEKRILLRLLLQKLFKNARR